MDDPKSSLLFKDLDPEQAEAVQSAAAPLCVLAGAGSGKTRVLTRRVAHRILDGSAEASHCLVLTFTRKAADELRQRLFSLGAGDEVTVGTFHAIAFAQLRQRWLDQGRPVPVIAASPTAILETALRTVRMTRSVNPRAISTEITWAKTQRLTPDNYQDGVSGLGHRPPVSPTQMRRIYEAYEQEKRKRRVLDFDDLLLLMTEALSSDKSFATAQRWRFRHFFVDEFQDLNQAQFDLLQAWLGDRDDLFVVGDSNQAIYGWNGADAKFLTNVDSHIRGVTTLQLNNNYRSTPHVLAAADAVLPSAKAKQIVSDDLSAVPTIRAYDTDELEGQGIARQVRLAHGRSWRWSDIAVLVRTNVQRSSIERALEQARIPYRSAGGAGWLHRPEVKAAMDHLKASPRHRLVERAADIEQIAQEASDGEREYLAELLAASHQCLLEDPNMTIADFLSWVEVSSRNDGPATAMSGAVTVTTFHRAKGLEWPVVFLSGIEEGLVPYNGSSSKQIEEERRLFYVAITRAQSELHLSWAQQRSMSGEISQRKASPWLQAIQEAGLAMEDDSTNAPVAHNAIEEGRNALRLHRQDASIDATRVAIERWRTARARLTGIEPKLILSDEALDAIVDLRPTTTEELETIEGFGPVRAATVGMQLLDLVRSSE